MPWLRATRKDEVPPGSIREFQINGHTIALSNVNGQFHAIDNTCLHRGGPLGQGVLEGTTVTCPWHGWEYDVTTGKVTQNQSVGVACYKVKVEGDDIFVEV